jgi:hypothetical protein
MIRIKAINLKQQNYHEHHAIRVSYNAAIKKTIKPSLIIYLFALLVINLLSQIIYGQPIYISSLLLGWIPVAIYAYAAQFSVTCPLCLNRCEKAYDAESNPAVTYILYHCPKCLIYGVTKECID